MTQVPFASFQHQIKHAKTADGLRIYGRVAQVVGLVIESTGPDAKIGDICSIELGSKNDVRAEVVGFRNSRLLLMPFGEMNGVRAGCVVRNTAHALLAPAGDSLLGRVLNGLGDPIDGAPIGDVDRVSIYQDAPDALRRRMITAPMQTGVKAIDALSTIGIGQRIGVFSGSGVGKSTLLGMIARSTRADVNVIALIGERGREVREFIQNDLGEEGLRRSVVVVATSDQPALVRIKAAFTATAIADWFRRHGRNVMLMMDSITRFATAQRELGLAIGEPPSTRGYTPSVFAILPKLLERAGNSDVGSVTGIYTVLVEGDDNNEPVADTARSILDGHIVLDRRLANSGHYPAIDVCGSLSRVMANIVDSAHVSAANRFRELVTAYREIEELVAIGAYQQGAKPLADEAIAKWPLISGFLRQTKDEAAPLEQTVNELMEIVNG